MSVNSAAVGLRLPAQPAAPERANKVVAMFRRFARRARAPRERLYVKAGGSYRIHDGRRSRERTVMWVHSHH